MMRENKNRIVRQREMYELSWITPVVDFWQVEGVYTGPEFETAEKDKWKIWISVHWNGDYDYFCYVERLLDDSPQKIRYSVSFKSFVGEKMSRDTPPIRQLWKNHISRSDSTVRFQMESVKEIEAYSSMASKKLFIRFRFQRKSILNICPKRLSIVSELDIWTISHHFCSKNSLYPSKEKESDPQERNISDEESNEESEYDIVFFGGDSHDADPWFLTGFILNLSDWLCRRQMHILDVNGQIHVSSERRMFECGSQPVIHRLKIITKEDIQKKRDILSRDGEITVRLESIEPDEYLYIANQEWKTFSCSQRNYANIRYDLENFFDNCSKDGDIEFRADREVLKAHKGIVRARSLVLNKMFSYNMNENLTNVICMKEIDSVTLKNFLKYLYFGIFDHNMEWQDACNLYAIAHKYYVHSLLPVCSRHLYFCTNSKNYEHILSHSILFEDKDLESFLTSLLDYMST